MGDIELWIVNMIYEDDFNMWGCFCRLSIFRWMIPPNGEVVIRLRFQSEELGQFDQTLNFEIIGTRRRYQLYCRGVCAFPSISREPRYCHSHVFFLAVKNFVSIQRNIYGILSLVLLARNFSLSRIVFPNRKKSKKSDEIVHKKYILATETFEFGPLSPGKSRAE